MKVTPVNASMRHDLILGAFSLPGNKNNYQRKKLFHFITQMKKERIFKPLA